jgi:hypothetical protein
MTEPEIKPGTSCSVVNDVTIEPSGWTKSILIYINSIILSLVINWTVNM